MKETYEIGDEAWIFTGLKDQKGVPILSKGRVVMSFYVPQRALAQYVILLDDPDFFAMEIRDVYLMSPTEGELPPFAQLAAPPVSVMRPLS